MSPGLRPLQLPLLVERRKKLEEEAIIELPVAALIANKTFEPEVSCTDHLHSEQHEEPVQHPLTMTDSISSDLTSPVTPTFSTSRHLRSSSSVSSFDLEMPVSCEDLSSSPTLVPQTSGQRLDDVEEEEPFEYDRFNHYVRSVQVACDNVSDQFDLYDCLCDEPCMHPDTGIVRSRTDFYAQGREIQYDLECLSDSDSLRFPLASRKRSRAGSMPALKGLSCRIGSRLPSFSRWRSPRKSSTVSSPVSDLGSERHSLSRAASSRSSSVSRSIRPTRDRSNEPAVPPTPALSFFESSDSITLPGPLDSAQADYVLSSIQRERAQATTPLLPPLMTGSSTDHGAVQPSPLQSPTVASPLEEESHSPLALSPALSTRPSISSIHQIMPASELPPNSDVWSNLLGHANFTILPVPYKPTTATLPLLHELRTDWEMARVNYTKHLVRTGEHYGLTSKTYAYTEEKWAEIDRTWRNFHDETVDAIIASGEATSCSKFDESIITTVPRMDGEGKFPERGDEDIVGPMVREAMMSSPDRKRPSFWRNISDRVGLRR
ncbi:hypothetical protein GGR50DRAFT_603742 [Xylaria sp. CBS 124048]|nr:hypothetical protein GGR50DRAFT_603742 [Xylaria sp. CBS 124048]